jgi:hypothetical protein
LWNSITNPNGYRHRDCDSNSNGNRHTNGDRHSHADCNSNSHAYSKTHSKSETPTYTQAPSDPGASSVTGNFAIRQKGGTRCPQRVGSGLASPSEKAIHLVISSNKIDQEARKNDETEFVEMGLKVPGSLIQIFPGSKDSCFPAFLIKIRESIPAGALDRDDWKSASRD